MSGSVDRLVRMVNQIATEFGHQQGSNAANATWDHLWHFWDPRMRHAISAYLEAGGPDLTPVAREAVILLATNDGPASQTRATEFAVDADGNTEGDAG